MARNLELQKVEKVSDFRKIAIGTWRTAYDPSVYGTLEVPMDEAMDYIRRFRDKTGLRLTVSHLMAKAAAAALEEAPDANALLRFNKVYKRDKISLFFQVAMTSEDDKIDLSGLTLHEVDKKTLPQIVQEFERKAEKVRTRQDPELEKTRKSFRWVPFMMMNWLLRALSFVMYTLNIRLPGTPKDAFGSMMITNVGSLGLDMAYVPLVPYARVPILLALGAVRPIAVVEDDEVVVRKSMKINATFDHRFIDGAHAAIMSGVFRRMFRDPDRYFGDIDDMAAAMTASPASDSASPSAA